MATAPVDQSPSGMEAIIQVVTTPIALAALAILVLGAAYQLSGRGRAANQQVFWLILVFGLLGTGSYLVQILWFSQEILKGDVRDQNSSPLRFAVVDIPGVGTTATAQDGSFQVPIPYSRQLKQYRLIVRVDGFDPIIVAVPGPRPEFVPITMTAHPVRIFDYVDIDDYITVSENVGDPLLLYSFRVKGSVEGRIKLSELRITLNNPQGLKTAYYPVGFQKNGQVVPFTGNYAIDKDETQSQIVFMFSPDGNRVFNMLQGLQRTHGPAWMDGCTTGVDLADDVLLSLQSYFDSVFSWSSGEFAMVISFRINDQVQELKYKFNLSDHDVAALGAIRGRLTRCAGVMFFPNQLPNLSYTDPVASNFVSVSIN